MFGIFSPLEHLMYREAENLSGGEMQMVAIARALVGSPGLVLFDEPSQGLAPKIVGDVLATVRRLKGDGVACLIVEQNAEVALSVADRAAVPGHRAPPALLSPFGIPRKVKKLDWSKNL
jgi:branched-chain amino acid transport system ATP-binding protein